MKKHIVVLVSLLILMGCTANQTPPAPEDGESIESVEENPAKEAAATIASDAAAVIEEEDMYKGLTLEQIKNRQHVRVQAEAIVAATEDPQYEDPEFKELGVLTQMIYLEFIMDYIIDSGVENNPDPADMANRKAENVDRFIATYSDDIYEYTFIFDKRYGRQGIAIDTRLMDYPEPHFSGAFGKDVPPSWENLNPDLVANFEEAITFCGVFSWDYDLTYATKEDYPEMGGYSSWELGFEFTDGTIVNYKGSGFRSLGHRDLFPPHYDKFRGYCLIERGKYFWLPGERSERIENTIWQDLPLE